MSEFITKEQVLDFIKNSYTDSIKVDPDAFYVAVKEKFKDVQNVLDRATNIWSKIVKYPTDSQLMEILYFAKKKNLDPLMRDFYVFHQKEGGILLYLGFESYFDLFKQYVPSKYSFHIEEGSWIDYTFSPKATPKEPHPQSRTIKVPSCLTCVLKDKSGCEVARLTEYFAENFTESKPWQTSPYKMLRSKVIAQTVRILLGDQGSLLDENDIEMIRSREREEAESESVVVSLPTAEELLHTLSSFGINGFVQEDKVFVDKRYGQSSYDTLLKLGFVRGGNGCFYQKCSTSQPNNNSSIQEPPATPLETPPMEIQEDVSNIQPSYVEDMGTPVSTTQEETPTLNSIENSLKESGILFETRMQDNKCYLLATEPNDGQIVTLKQLGFTYKRRASGEGVWAMIF